MQRASCKEDFIEGDTFTTFCICHFHANEKRNGRSGFDCAGVSATEKRVFKLKTKTLVVIVAVNVLKMVGVVLNFWKSLLI